MKDFKFFLLKSTLFSTIFLIIFILFLATDLYQRELRLKDKIYPNVYINGENFGYRNRHEVEEYFLKKNAGLEKKMIQIKFENDEIATFSGTTLNLKYDAATLAVQAASIGRSPNLSSRVYQKIKTLYNLGRFSFRVLPSYDARVIEDYLTYLEDKYNKPAENALFKFEDGKVTAFKIEKNGLRIKKEKARIDFDEALKNIIAENKNDTTIPIEKEIIKPEITLSSSNDFGIVEKIGEGKSDYSGSIPERVHNVILAASKFNGVLIPKNHTFSFNETVGDISASTGYKPAYVIKNGRTVLGDGGGVCQVSTTLFRAALNSGLPITERTAHAYRVHYYENDGKPGYDATVFGPTVDLKFRNDTPAYILIQTEVLEDQNLLIFNLYGKKDERKVTLSEAKVWDIVPPPPPAYQDDPTLKRGVTKQVDWPAWGAKAIFHYKVENKGQVGEDRDFFSNFRPWQAVYLVGTAD